MGFVPFVKGGGKAPAKAAGKGKTGGKSVKGKFGAKAKGKKGAK